MMIIKESIHSNKALVAVAPYSQAIEVNGSIFTSDQLPINLHNLPKAEIMLIMILFYDSGYRCLKHFYQEKYVGTFVICFPM